MLLVTDSTGHADFTDLPSDPHSQVTDRPADEAAAHSVSLFPPAPLRLHLDATSPRAAAGATSLSSTSSGRSPASVRISALTSTAIGRPHSRTRDVAFDRTHVSRVRHDAQELPLWRFERQVYKPLRSPECETERSVAR